jgi:site-specific recombinase XerD
MKKKINDKYPFLGELLRGWFHWLAEEKNVSPHTVASYRDTFILFIRHLADTSGNSPDILTFDEHLHEHIVDFLQHLERDRHVSIITRNLRLSALKSFCRYVAYKHPLLSDYCRRITFIPVKRRSEPLLDYLEAEEMEAIIGTVDCTHSEGRRDYTILLLLYNTGCRVSELTTLNRDDFHNEAPKHIRILGKGRRWRIVPLWERTVAAIKRTLEDRDDKLPCMFLGQRGNSITRFGVRHLLKKYRLLAQEKMPGLAKKRISPHTIRHTTAVALLRATGDIDGVSKILGHRSLNTTKIYTASDRTHLAATLNKVASALIPAAEENWNPDANLLTWLEKL